MLAAHAVRAAAEPINPAGVAGSVAGHGKLIVRTVALAAVRAISHHRRESRSGGGRSGRWGAQQSGHVVGDGLETGR